MTISNIKVSTLKTYTTDTLNTGKLQYIDRTYTFSTVPSKYIGMTYIKTANADKAVTTTNFLEFDEDKNTTIYISYDDRITTKPLWLSSFTDTNDNIIANSVTFSLYKKNFVYGHIVLGGNNGGSNCTYNVIIQENTTTSTTDYPNNKTLNFQSNVTPGQNQTISNYEWSINNTTQSINNANLSINTSTLPLGISNISLRVNNTCGKWSDIYTKTINIVKATNMSTQTDPITINLPTQLVTVTLRRKSNVTVTVKESDGTLVVGTTVDIAGVSGTTDVNGQVTLNNVPYGTQTITTTFV